MYFLARFNGMIIIGQLHNSKTAARTQTRIGRSGPLVIRNYLHSPSLSYEEEGRESKRERKRQHARQARNSRARRDKVLAEIIQHFETLGLPLSRDPNSSPAIPASGLPVTVLERGNIRVEIPTETSCEGYGYTHSIDAHSNSTHTHCAH